MDSQYLTLLRKALAFELWDEPPVRPIESTGAQGWKARSAKAFDRLLNHVVNLRIAMNKPPGGCKGVDWPLLAHTMIGPKRLDNIRELCEIVVRDNIPGSWCECGVWRGGASIMARHCLPLDRKVICCDSFEGLPYHPDEPHWSKCEFLKVSQEEVRENFRRYGITDNVRFVKGWFKDTLRTIKGPIAILRADADMFASTLQILTELYPKVSPRGFVIIDDFHLEPCYRAVVEFLKQSRIYPEIVDIDGSGVFWRKE